MSETPCLPCLRGMHGLCTEDFCDCDCPEVIAAEVTSQGAGGLDLRQGGKVEYWLHPNYAHTSTAYLDEMPEGREIFHGTDKHTDSPVTVRWTGERYEQLPTRLP